MYTSENILIHIPCTHMFTVHIDIHLWQRPLPWSTGTAHGSQGQPHEEPCLRTWCKDRPATARPAFHYFWYRSLYVIMCLPPFLSKSKFVYIQKYMNAYVYIYVYIYMCVWKTYMYTCIFANMYTHIDHTHIIYIYIYLFIFIYSW